MCYPSLSAKGKQRAVGERPSDLPYLKTVEPAKSASETPSNAGDVESDVSEPDTGNSESGATSGESDDPLMAGDYRPLKSALKKSKKKPRQKKNIHHNYFMTMRGWRPHLVPFPHGCHPKPHAPRNDMWWDNVPKNVDHIMAPPAILKAPEGEIEENEKGKEKKEDKAKEKDTDAGEKREEKKGRVGEDKNAEKVESESPSTSETSSSRAEAGSEKSRSKPPDGKKGKEKATDPEKSKDASTDKEKERAKLKAEAEAKQKAKLGAEAEAKAKESSRSTTSTTPPAVPIDRLV